METIIKNKYIAGALAFLLAPFLWFAFTNIGDSFYVYLISFIASLFLAIKGLKSNQSRVFSKVLIAVITISFIITVVFDIIGGIGGH